MEHQLFLYNTLSRKKENFIPLHSPLVGMYVCGPTVYGEPHLGHARPTITFDLLFRYLQFCGYKVRYVRNITDVGHLENDADEGEDKIAKKARLEALEPMEIAQFYTNSYHEAMEKLNTLPPSIEPRASGHIFEQLEMIEQIFERGFAYEINGSVYFDVEKYSQKFHYGKLSGRVLDELFANTRELEGQREKRNSFDFALWKKAKPEHIMRWNSKWSEGFPGWHLECSAMSKKYLGEVFDIHGGGMDLIFPHHECEIAQSQAAFGQEAVKCWVHNNLITINGQKMGKSLGNFITLSQLFTGQHSLLEKSYSPMNIRFFILQAHYRNPLDFSNSALQAAEKAYQRLMSAISILEKLPVSEKTSIDVENLRKNCFEALNDDLNTPILFSHLFEGVRFINSVNAGTESIAKNDLETLKKLFNEIVFDILGLQNEVSDSQNSEILDSVMNLLLNLRIELKKEKNFTLADKIRNELSQFGIEVKDKKDGFEWNLKK